MSTKCNTSAAENKAGWMLKRAPAQKPFINLIMIRASRATAANRQKTVSFCNVHQCGLGQSLEREQQLFGFQVVAGHFKDNFTALSDPAAMAYCAINFDAFNSSLAIPSQSGMRLIEFELGCQGMPTAVFFNAGDETRCRAREAVVACVGGFNGRLMRSIKSILGSALMDQATEIGHSIIIKYIDVGIGYHRHQKALPRRSTAACSRA